MGALPPNIFCPELPLLVNLPVDPCNRLRKLVWLAGNRAAARVVFKQPGFNFSLILHLLHDDDRAVQTVAGDALAAFSYNIASNQRLIARCAGHQLTFAHFTSILREGDELQRSKAAFQVR